MRMKSIKKSRSLRDAANEFLSFKKAQKARERTLKDYEKYIFPFVDQSSNSMESGTLENTAIAPA